MTKIDRFPLYEFHEKGFVISHVKKKPKILSPIKMGEYLGFQLCRDDGLLEKIYLHRAICEAFNGPCPEGFECRHLNGDKNDNQSKNLKWGTKKENEEDKKAHGSVPYGEQNPMAKLTKIKVLEMRKIRNEANLSYKKIGLMFNVSTMTAFRAITKRNWKND